MTKRLSTSGDDEFVTNKLPKVSVVVPNYNHARFLARRLDSILNQTYVDYELIILDDASTDDSKAVIEPYLANPRVSFHPNARNSGTTFAQWNLGIRLARGEFVWIAESDDVAAPEFLEKLVALLEENPSAGVAYCQSYRVSANKPVPWSFGIPYFPDGYIPKLTSQNPECQKILAALLQGDWTEDAIAMRKYGGQFKYKARKGYHRKDGRVPKWSWDGLRMRIDARLDRLARRLAGVQGS